jgi:hypothetical protein
MTDPENLSPEADTKRAVLDDLRDLAERWDAVQKVQWAENRALSDELESLALRGKDAGVPAAEMATAFYSREREPRTRTRWMNKVIREAEGHVSWAVDREIREAQVQASPFGVVEAAIGNGLDGFYRVRAPGDGSLVWSFTVERQTEEQSFAPDAAAWERFWAVVDRLDVWSWAGSYERPDVLDGTYWSLALDRGERRVRSWGDNAYPDGDDPGRDFRALCRAVSHLAEGRTFA